MKVSVVTAYYNRKKLFRNTLLQLKNSSSSDFEVIAVDDGSDEDQRLEDLQNEFDFLKVVRLEKKDKWYINPCVPFNKGFVAATGNIIILQNPECIHYGDIIGYVKEHLQPNNYLSFAAYSLDKKTTDSITDAVASDIQSLKVQFNPFAITYDGESGWYNHSAYKPQGFHWCAAIHADALKDLGGFDDRYALGVAFDDNELLIRIKKKGMDFRIIDSPFVLHQHHFKINTDTNKSINPFYTRPEAKLLWDKNEYLFNHYTLKKKDWRSSAHSISTLRFFDFLLTSRLKSKRSFQSLSWRIKNKIARTFRKS